MNNLGVNAEHDRHPFPEEKLPGAFADCRDERCSFLPHLIASYTSTRVVTPMTRPFRPVSIPVFHNYWNTCAKSLFAKLWWEFSVFNRPQNFSSLPWGEVLWFSSCTWGLHLNHLRSEVQYLLKAASLFSASLFRHTWIFFFLSFFLFFLTSKWGISS